MTTYDAAETIDELVDRLRTSTLLNDKRDASRGLFALASDYRVQVGAQAMQPIIETIKDTMYDSEIVNTCLACLNKIISGRSADALPDEMHRNGIRGHDPGLELTEIFLKDLGNLATVLETFDDGKTKHNALKLLRGLAMHKLNTVQDWILSHPPSLNRLMDLIATRDLEEIANEVIRNDALLLFVDLTKSNQQIQNLFAYESGFAKLMDIVKREDYLSGGAVTIDCLNILLNLLQDNESNQILFRDAGHIQEFVPFFDEVLDESRWTDQRILCIVRVMQTLDSMIVPCNTPAHVQACQTIMQKCGLLDKLCQLLTSQTLPLGVRSEIMNTASDIMRGQLNEKATLVIKVPEYVCSLAMLKDMIHDQDKRISNIETYMEDFYKYVKQLDTMLRAHAPAGIGFHEPSTNG